MNQTTRSTLVKAFCKSFYGLALPILLASCGGGGGDSPPTTTPALAIPILADADDQAYTAGQAITTLPFPSSGGAVASCRIATNPALPTGLKLDVSGTTCQITGTPAMFSGENTYTITATNTTGSDTATVKITVKAATPTLNAPDLTDADDQTYTAGQTIPALTFMNMGGDIQASGCAVDIPLPMGLILVNTANSQTCQITGAPTIASGKTTYTITATNATGSDIDTTIKITVSDPVSIGMAQLTSTGDSAPLTDDTLTLTFTTTGDPNFTPQVRIGGQLATVVAGDAAGQWVATLMVGANFPSGDQGFDVIVVVPKGASPTEDLSRGITIAAVPATPETLDLENITAFALTPILALETTSYTFTKDEPITAITFTNGGGDVEADGCNVNTPLPQGLGLDVDASDTTCEITGTPEVEDDSGDYIITAINAAGESMLTITIEVDVALLAPNLSDTPLAETVTTGTNFSTTITNNGGGELSACFFLDSADNNSEQASLGGLSIAVVGNDCEITGSLTTTQTFTVRATNAINSDEATIVFTVTDALLAPNLPDTPLAETVTAGATFPAITVANNGGGELSACFFLDSADNNSEQASLGGLSIAVVGNDCEITGALTDLDPQTFTVRATNNTQSDEATIVFTVNPEAPILMTDAGAQTYTVGQAITDLTFTNTGGAVEASGCNVNTPLPRGLNLDVSGNTCQITGVPEVAAALKSYTITANKGVSTGMVIIAITVNKGTDTLSFGEVTNDAVELSGDKTMASITYDVANLTFTRTATSDSATRVATYEISGDAGVATVVSGTGVVTIVGVGTTMITATRTEGDNYNQATATYTLTVMPAPVSMVNGASTGSGTISLWWPVVEGANSYQVYRHTVNSEETVNGRTLLTDPAINASNYDDSASLTAAPYFYWVKACEGENCSNFSDAVEVALVDGTAENPYAVITVAHLQAIGAAAPSDTLTTRLESHYALARDIDLSDIANWTPIGDVANKFTGSFDGQGFEISGLNSSGHRYAGLFGYVEDASLSNIGVLVGTVSASSDSHAGGLAGHANSSSISNSYAIVTGDISASGASSSRTGGLVGVAEENSPIRNSYAIVTGNISSSTSSTSSVSNAGGLVGSAFSNSPISNSYAEVTGNISASSTSTSSFSNAGGLVGLAQTNSPIRNSYAIVTGDISSSGTSASNAGGLVGEASNSPVSNSYYSARRKASEGAFRNTEGATLKTVAELKAPTGLSDIYESWTAFYDADSMPAHALITDASVSFVDGTDRRAWYFGDDAQLPTLNPSPVDVADADLELNRARQHFVATASSATQVDLSWSDARTAANPITYYEVYRHTANDNSVAEVAGPIASPMVSSATGRTYMNTGLTAGTTYYYWLKACQGEGATASCSDFFAHAQATPKEPPAPASMVNGASTGSGTISLWWPVVEGANSYQVYRHTVNSEETVNGRTLLTDPAINASNYDDSASLTAAPYFYWVKACEGENCSNFSDAVEVALVDGTAENPYAVITVAHLQAIGAAAPSDTLTDRLAGRYALARDIDLSDISNWTPIGDEDNKFTGSFDGQGFEISGLNSSGHQFAGLFGYVEGASLSNIGVLVGTVSASSDVSFAGGLVGLAFSNSSISNSYVVVSGDISASSNAGGLVGRAESNSTISNSYAEVTGNISASSTSSDSHAGGLAGHANSSSISNSYAIVTGDISSSGASSSNAGGLVGFAFSNSPISNSYAIVAGNISSSSTSTSSVSNAGGLVGRAESNSPISNSYAEVTGNISASSTSTSSFSNAGGLVGLAQTNSPIRNSYAIVTGDISSSGTSASNAGGLVGEASNSPVSNSYYSARRKASEGAFRNTEGATLKTVAELKAPTGLSDIYESWTAFYDADSMPAHALITDASVSFVDGTDRRAWYFGDDAQLPTLNPSPVDVADADLELNRARQHFVATASSATQVDLSWSDARTAANPITYYEVYRHTANDNSVAEVAGPIASPMVSSATGRTYMNTGLTAGTTYYYWLKACQGEGANVNCSDFFAHTQATTTKHDDALTFGEVTNSAVTISGTVASITYDVANLSFTRTATSESATGAVTYEISGEEGVATVVSDTGVVTILSVGTTEITATRASDVAYNVATVSYTLTVNGLISTVADLENIRTNESTLGGNYTLTRDIDLPDGLNWTPIGDGTDNTNRFTGSFDGQGFEISGLNSSGHQYAGLFGYMEGASISNIGVLVGNISSSDSHAGGLVGRANSSSISNSYAIIAGGVSSSSSNSRAGGLVGVAEENSPIRNSYAIVTGNISSSTSSFRDSYAGGLVGAADVSPISNSYAVVTGDISSSSSRDSNAGGLVGRADGSPISNSYAVVTGDISSSSSLRDSNAGGLVGFADW